MCGTQLIRDLKKTWSESGLISSSAKVKYTSLDWFLKLYMNRNSKEVHSYGENVSNVKELLGVGFREPGFHFYSLVTPDEERNFSAPELPNV